MKGRPPIKKQKCNPVPNHYDKELFNVEETEVWEDGQDRQRMDSTSHATSSNGGFTPDLPEDTLKKQIPTIADAVLSNSYQRGQAMELASRNLLSLGETKMEACDCCFPPKIFKNRSDKYYHIRVRRNKGEEKSQKKHGVFSAEDFIDKQLPILTRAVLRDNYQAGKTLELITELLSDQLILIQEDVIAYCSSEIAKLDSALAEQKGLTALAIGESADNERLFFTELSQRTDSRAVYQDSQGVEHACTTSDWQIKDDDLELLHRSMQAKVSAIDQEMKRRAMLPTQIVLKYLLEKIVNQAGPR